MNKTNIQYGFVILHYMALEMTMQCVDNLVNKFGEYNIIIVIVDNYSPNGTGIKLQQKYKDNNLVTVILHDKNDGFARGNNIGFNYLKQNYNIDFMIVMNNDVIIEQDEFLNKIKEIYNKKRFAVLGPSIYAPQIGLYQNPGPLNIATEQQTKNFIKTYKKYIRNDNWNYYKLKILHYTVFWWAKHIYKLFHKKENKKEENTPKPQVHQNTKTMSEVTNSVLCGACYIFSKDFINNREYCFYPKTFLYFEEQILAYQCRKLNLPMLYSPLLEVKHLVGISSSQSETDNRRRYLSMWKENIKSAKIYLDILKSAQ